MNNNNTVGCMLLFIQGAMNIIMLGQVGAGRGETCCIMLRVKLAC